MNVSFNIVCILACIHVCVVAFVDACIHVPRDMLYRRAWHVYTCLWNHITVKLVLECDTYYVHVPCVESRVPL